MKSKENSHNDGPKEKDSNQFRMKEIDEGLCCQDKRHVINYPMGLNVLRVVI